MLLRGLFMSAFVSSEIVSSTKRLSAVALMIPLLEMNRIHMHFHMRPLSKVSVTVRAAPFLLTTMCSSNVPLQRITAIKGITAMRAVIVPTRTVFGGHVNFQVVAPSKRRPANMTK